MENLLDNKTEMPNAALRKKLLLDIVAQVTLLATTALGILIIAVLDGNDYGLPAAVFYLGLGGYQLITSLVHLAYGKPPVLYVIYYCQLGIYLFLFMGLFGAGSIGCGYILLLVTPLSAIYYLTITIITHHHAKK